MTISSFKPGSLTRSSSDLLVSMRRDMMELQRQLATGQKAETYGGLGFERRTSLNLQARLSAMEAFVSAIDQASLRIKIVTQNLERIDKLASETKSDMSLSKFELLSDGRTFAQKNAEQRFMEAIDLLNADLAGRTLFSGRAVDKLPVETYDRIMNGDGPRAGLKQLVEERLAAERGATGLGRLALAQAGNTVSITQEAAALPFGFKVTAGPPTGTAISVVNSGGATPGSTFTIGGLPNDGDTVTVTLTDPVGTEHTIRLTARSTITGDGTGFQIGATAAETAQNLTAALDAAIKDKVNTALLPQAAMATAQAFFDAPSSMPQRIAGPPFEMATATVAGTAADTMIWYVGDNDPAVSARDTAPTRVDDTQVVGTGARANEPALRNILAQLGVLSARTFTDTRGDKQFYTALSENVFQNLADKPSNPKVSEIVTELAHGANTLSAAKARHAASESMLLDTVQDVELVSKEEASLALLDLQTRLQASYQTTSILSQLSLVNYL